MKTNRKITFTVTKEEYDIIFKFYTLIGNLDSKVYDDVCEAIMGYDVDFFDMIDILMSSLEYPKESEMPSAKEIFRAKCMTGDCVNCPLKGKCAD